MYYKPTEKIENAAPSVVLGSVKLWQSSGIAETVPWLERQAVGESIASLSRHSECRKQRGKKLGSEQRGEKEQVLAEQVP